MLVFLLCPLVMKLLRIDETLKDERVIVVKELCGFQDQMGKKYSPLLNEFLMGYMKNKLSLGL